MGTNLYVLHIHCSTCFQLNSITVLITIYTPFLKYTCTLYETLRDELLIFYHFFQDARSDAEEHIYSKLNLKISEFIELGMSFFLYIYFTYLCLLVLWNVYPLCNEVEKGFKNTLTKTYTYWYTNVICMQIYYLKVLNLFVSHKLRTKENCLCSSVCSLYALLKNVKSIWNTISYF